MPDLTDGQLLALLEEAERVGYARAEWVEATEIWKQSREHPYYADRMKADELAYREARRELYAHAEIEEGPLP